MLLKNLIKNYHPKKKIKIYGLATNSKKVKRGYIFFAIKGKKNNGEKFINEAIKNGAVLIVCSKKSKYINYKIPTLKINNIREFLSRISSKFYSLKPKNIIAVTGTNGKTSVADLFYQILNSNNVPVASVGTLGIKYKKKLIKSDLTSPDTISTHRILKDIKLKKIDNVIIESSSHGLDQKRLNDLKFKAGIFTNFSQDHLDYHKNMKSYLNSKLILFNKILSKKSFIISDSTIKEFKILKKIAKKRKLKLIDIYNIEKKLKKLKNLKMNDFQLKNLAMAIAAAKICKLNDKKIFKSLNKIKGVDGRLELVKTFPNNIKVLIDYAHTPDALFKSISAIKNLYGENISLVFGCGGDRDKKKRPLMAKIASLNCKKIYVTDDNPRQEDPKKIRNIILKNIKNKNKYNIGNRMGAIRFAIANASQNEIILVAGKGHEDQQIYKKKVLNISDKQIIKKLNFKIKKISKKEQNYLENVKIAEEIIKKRKIKKFHGLAIDSRQVTKNNLFLTIKGKNNDGVKFAGKALKRGAKYIVSSRNIKNFKNKTIKVSSEINFLKKFSSLKRKNSSAKIIAVTGSAGKTSLKNLIQELLQNFGKTYSSPKSYNNQFGVPLSLSNLKAEHKFGVFEVGMSKSGEINNLSKLVKPNIGIITNIGEAHIENFKSIKGIADAKGEIINNIQKDGSIILNRDDKFFHYLEKKAKLKKIKIISFGKNKKSDIVLVKFLKNENFSKLVVRIKNEIFKFRLKDINIHNVLSSLALLRVLNLNIKKIIKNFKNYRPTEGRGKIHLVKRYKKNFKLIDESYNANPLSVKNAISNFKSLKKHYCKKYLLLGDMLELGKNSTKYHTDLSQVINNSDIDKVFVKGNKTLATYRHINKNKRGNIFQHDEDVDFTLKNIIANNDYLMIKGSNATGLNNLSKKIIKGY